MNRTKLCVQSVCVFVLQHVRPKYACAACQGNVAIAERLPEPIEKGLPAGLVRASGRQKARRRDLPLHRQRSRIFKRFGVELSRSTMCDWAAAVADLLAPLVRAMLERVLTSRVIQTDDTPVKVQDHDAKGIKTGRLWVYIGDAADHFVVYDYTPDRSRDGPERIFKGYTGYLQADAYPAYDRLFADGTIQEVGCWMHARRKFYEARTSDPERSYRYRRGHAHCTRSRTSWAKPRKERTPSGTPRPGTRTDMISARNDPGRSWMRFTRGWSRSSPGCCPRARSARRSVIRRTTGMP